RAWVRSCAAGGVPCGRDDASYLCGPPEGFEFDVRQRHWCTSGINTISIRRLNVNRRTDFGDVEGGRAAKGRELYSDVLPAIFEKQADARPEAPAVTFGPERTTYSDLEALANRVAHHLRRKGASPGSLVALLLPRSIDAYAAILGILKAGAAYVPIDVSSPPDRIAYILRDSGAKVLVTTAAMANRVAFAGPVVRMDADREAISAESDARLRREAGASSRDLCYVIYTSGSTGRPKGVMVEHRNVCHVVRAEGELFGVQPDDRVYQGASLAFDLSVEEMWLAFHAGATLVAATPEMVRAGPDLARLLSEHHVTVL